VTIMSPLRHHRSALLVQFESFRVTIDDYNDTRERFIKVSELVPFCPFRLSPLSDEP